MAQRALRFLKAGGDLVIVGDPTLAPAMVDAVRAQAQKDPCFAAQVTYKAKLVVAMKAPGTGELQLSAATVTPWQVTP